jgi:hypothetical protein
MRIDRRNMLRHDIDERDILAVLTQERPRHPANRACPNDVKAHLRAFQLVSRSVDQP